MSFQLPNQLQKFVFLSLVALSFLPCSLAGQNDQQKTSNTDAPEFPPPSLLARPIPKLSYRVIEQAPHPDDFFTQGFIFHQGFLFETSGLYGKSFLARYDAKHNASKPFRPIKQRLPNRLFAEGLTRFNNRFFLLTWKSGQAWELDDNWQRKQVWKYDGEGWGLTHNNQHLILSDGSHKLRFYDAQFNLQHTLAVSGGGIHWDRLNELEYVDGIIYANRWYENHIIAIDAQTGQVVGKIDLTSIARPHRRKADHVLNGIAWHPERKGFWITGKMWSTRYFIQLDDQPRSNKTPNRLNKPQPEAQ